jgi:hypothetical protein
VVWRILKLLIHALLKAMRGQKHIQSHHHADRYTATALGNILAVTSAETLEFNQLSWKEHLIPP